ncbi:hypothetical protein IAT38_005510 [Cryptococcus sp. DSM 104549]
MVSGASLEVVPTVKLVGLVTIRALDSLPLPLLVVIFLACLALLQWPISPPPSLLPTFTPPTADKSRLSPSPLLEKPAGSAHFHFAPLPSTSSQTALGHFGPGGKGQQQQVVVLPPKGRNVRRGSKQLREWRSGLGVVEEVEGEVAEREMV